MSSRLPFIPVNDFGHKQYCNVQCGALSKEELMEVRRSGKFVQQPGHAGVQADVVPPPVPQTTGVRCHLAYLLQYYPAYLQSSLCLAHTGPAEV